MSDNVKPKIFIPSEGNCTLKDVLLERYENFDIFWYHWPYDGWFKFVQDYEPVIIVYDKNEKICQVITRSAWAYQHYNIAEIDPSIEIIFDTSFHHPLVKLSSDYPSDEYEMKKKPLIETQYEPKPIDSTTIPDMFRIGVGHITAFGRIVEDPKNIGNEAVTEYCSSI